MPEIIASPKMRNNTPLYIALGSVLAVAIIAGFLFLTPAGKGLIQKITGDSSRDADERDAPIDPTLNDANAERYTSEGSKPELESRFRDDAAKKIESGQEAEAEASYESLVRQTAIPSEKSKLYLDLSDIFFAQEGGPNLQKALQYAKLAEDVYPDVFSAARLVLVHHTLGDESTADKYSQLLEQRDAELQKAPSKVSGVE